MKKHIKDIPKFTGVRNLEHDGDDTDLRLHVHSIDSNWFCNDEKHYVEIENEIDAFEIKRKAYTVHMWCDVSGFDYWMKQMDEPNYIQVTVSFNELYTDENDLNELANDVEKAIDKVYDLTESTDIEQYWNDLKAV